MNGVSCICHYTGHHPTQWSVVRLLNSNYNSDMTKVVSIVITKQHPSLSSTLHLHPCDQSQVIKQFLLSFRFPGPRFHCICYISSFCYKSRTYSVSLFSPSDYWNINVRGCCEMYRKLVVSIRTVHKYCIICQKNPVAALQWFPSFCSL